LRSRVAAFWSWLDAIELPLVHWLQRRRGHYDLQNAARALTRAGDHGAIWHVIALAGQAVDRRRRDRWRAVNVAVLAAYVVNTALKLVLARGRPPTPGVGTLSVLSFPSAHAATSAAADRTLRGLLPRIVVLPLAVSVSLSRLYFGVHYLSDIVVGGVLGRLIARATLRRWR
jgi:undecaprenyl-diphosphatase